PVQYENQSYGEIQIVGTAGVELARSSLSFVQDIARVLAIGISRESTMGTKAPVSAETDSSADRESHDRRFEVIAETVQAMNAPDINAELKSITESMWTLFGWSSAIGLIGDSRVYFVAVTCPPDVGTPAWPDEGLPLGVGVTGSVAETGEPVFLRDVAGHSRYLATSDDVVSEICVPIYAAGALAGVLNVESHHPDILHEADVSLLTVIARIIGLGMVPEGDGNPGGDSVQAYTALVTSISDVLSRFEHVEEAAEAILSLLVEAGDIEHAAVLLRRGHEFVLLAQAGAEDHALPPSIALRTEVVESAISELDEPGTAAGFYRDIISGREADTEPVILPLRHAGDLLGLLIMQLRSNPEGAVTIARDVVVGHLSFLLASARTQSELKRLAALDPITEVPNHRFFQQKLVAECKLARRESRKLSLMVIDLDDFKTINDTYGHMVGDAVLRSTAATLTALLRGDDLLARYAGDEFVALLDNADHVIAEQVARRLVNTVASQPFAMPDGSSLTLTLSIGIATLPDDGVTGHDLLRAADSAMYITKDIGKNGIGHHRDSTNVKRADLTRRLNHEA
ncbi:MAG: diguanylate cyclase, partial [Chloroflexota bacterium]